MYFVLSLWPSEIPVYRLTDHVAVPVCMSMLTIWKQFIRNLLFQVEHITLHICCQQYQIIDWIVFRIFFLLRIPFFNQHFSRLFCDVLVMPIDWCFVDYLTVSTCTTWSIWLFRQVFSLLFIVSWCCVFQTEYIWQEEWQSRQQHGCSQVTWSARTEKGQVWQDDNWTYWQGKTLLV